MTKTEALEASLKDAVKELMVDHGYLEQDVNRIVYGVVYNVWQYVYAHERKKAQ